MQYQINFPNVAYITSLVVDKFEVYVHRNNQIKTLYYDGCTISKIMKKTFFYRLQDGRTSKKWNTNIAFLTEVDFSIYL